MTSDTSTPNPDQAPRDAQTLRRRILSLFASSAAGDTASALPDLSPEAIAQLDDPVYAAQLETQIEEAIGGPLSQLEAQVAQDLATAPLPSPEQREQMRLRVRDIVQEFLRQHDPQAV